jgi:hypothetical protein
LVAVRKKKHECRDEQKAMQMPIEFVITKQEKIMAIIFTMDVSAITSAPQQLNKVLEQILLLINQGEIEFVAVHAFD